MKELKVIKCSELIETIYAIEYPDSLLLLNLFSTSPHYFLHHELDII